MTYRQIALLGCVGDHVTPLMSSKEDFSGLVVSGLEEGGEVSVELEGVSTPFLLGSGLNPFCESYRFKPRFAIRKVAGPSPRPTSVEILRGG